MSSRQISSLSQRYHSGSLVGSHNLHRDLDVDLGMQMNTDRKIAQLLNRPFGHANLGTLNLDLHSGQRLCDIDGTNRAEQLALAARVRLDDDFEAFEGLRAFLGLDQLRGSRFFELCTCLLYTSDAADERVRV